MCYWQFSIHNILFKRLSGNEMTVAPSANYDHLFSSIGDYRNQAVTVGSQDHTKVEKFNGSIWTDLGDFEHAHDSSMINYYSMVTLGDELFLFGTFIILHY